MKHATAFTLNRYTQGGFDVRAENGLCVGQIVNCNGAWCAEVRRKQIGCFPQKEDGAEAVLQYCGITSMVSQMEAVLASRFPQLLRVDGLFEHDVRIVEDWHCATNFVWIITESGTHLHPMDCPDSVDVISDVIDFLRPNEDMPELTMYHINFHTLHVEPVTETEVRSLLFFSPVYSREGDTVRRYNQIVGRISTAPAHALGYNAARYSHVAVECVGNPDQGTIAVLTNIAFKYLRQENSQMGAAPASVTVRQGRTVHYHWANNAS